MATSRVKHVLIEHACIVCGLVRQMRKHLFNRPGFTGMCRRCSSRKSGLTKKHGETGTRLYRIWSGMKRRCLNPRDKDYANYGGRGIAVCERWRDSYEAFRDDMGQRPAGKTLDRIDNNGPYSPENCTWSTIRDQGNNRRVNRLLTYRNRTQTMAQWAREVGMSPNLLELRLRSGWTMHDALTMASQRIGPRNHGLFAKRSRT